MEKTRNITIEVWTGIENWKGKNIEENSKIKFFVTLFSIKSSKISIKTQWSWKVKEIIWRKVKATTIKNLTFIKTKFPV